MTQLRFFSFLISLALLVSSFKYSCDTVPELNKEIIQFVKSKIKKKVGKGECWDLAAAALDHAGANWDHEYKFGKEINFNKECVFPGDIIQFEGVEIEYTEKNTFYHQDLEHHTAIIFEVKEKGNYVMAEQNTAMHGRKVSLDPLVLSNITKGKFRIFRPVK